MVLWWSNVFNRFCSSWKYFLFFYKIAHKYNGEGGKKIGQYQKSQNERELMFCFSINGEPSPWIFSTIRTRQMEKGYRCTRRWRLRAQSARIRTGRPKKIPISSIFVSLQDYLQFRSRDCRRGSHSDRDWYSGPNEQKPIWHEKRSKEIHVDGSLLNHNNRMLSVVQARKADACLRASVRYWF